MDIRTYHLEELYVQSLCKDGKYLRIPVTKRFISVKNKIALEEKEMQKLVSDNESIESILLEIIFFFMLGATVQIKTSWAFPQIYSG